MNDRMIVYVISGRPYMDKQEICNELGVCKATVQTLAREIEAESGKTKRYPDKSVIRMGNKYLRVNRLVLYDYLKYRDNLSEKNLRKSVPAFNPGEWAQLLGHERLEVTA